MHILIVPSEHFVTELSPLAGIFQLEQAKALASIEHQVNILSVGFITSRYTFRSYPYKASENIGAISVIREYKRLYFPHRLQSPSSLIKKYVDLFLKNFDTYILKFGTPDIIHAHNCFYAGFIAKTVKEKYGIPYVVTEHSSSLGRGLLSKGQIDLLSSVFDNSNAAIVVSNALGEDLKQAVGQDLIVLPNVVDDLFFEGRRDINPRKRYRFINVARLDANKNHSLLIESFANSFKDLAVELIIIGDGPLKEQVKQLVKELKVEKQVKFLGSVSKNTVKQELLKADCFVLSSIYETFGVVIIEALACGLPVISTKSGGPEGIVNSDNGILVANNDVTQLSSAMQHMFINSKSFDHAEIRQKTQNSFGSNAFKLKLVTLYEQVLGVEHKTEGEK